jgi:poly-gamma-glutamate capsule biosynthesis protein CapA/YwtB (metallophosphatase superfamily)
MRREARSTVSMRACQPTGASHRRSARWSIATISPRCARAFVRRDRKPTSSVASVHWGLLKDRVAIGDYQREAAHAFIDAGADLILGHGTLVTKGIEVYQGKVIFYSLGKFLMRGPRPAAERPIGVNAAIGNHDKRKGMAARVDIEHGRIARVAFTPTFADEQSRPHFLTAQDPRFGQIADEVAAIGRAAGLSATSTRGDDRVVIT